MSTQDGKRAADPGARALHALEVIALELGRIRELLAKRLPTGGAATQRDVAEIVSDLLARGMRRR